MSDHVSIRQLGMPERDAYFVFRLDALEAHPQAFATSAEAWQTAPPEKIDALLQASENNTDPILGAFTSSAKLVGSVGLSCETRQSVKHKASLVSLYVDPEWRGQGIGARLVAEALRHARQLPDLILVRLVVDSENGDAVRLFERSGFREYGREPQARRVEERFYDQSYMLCFLHEPVP